MSITAERKAEVIKDNAQGNLGVLRRVALSLLKNAPELKGSVDSRRKQAGWDEAILEKVLFGRELGGD